MSVEILRRMRAGNERRNPPQDARTEAEEVLLLVGFLWRIETDSGWAVRTARMLDIVMGGLAATETASA